MPVLQTTATNTVSRRNRKLVGAPGFVAQAGNTVLVQWVHRNGCTYGTGGGGWSGDGMGVGVGAGSSKCDNECLIIPKGCAGSQYLRLLPIFLCLLLVLFHFLLCWSVFWCWVGLSMAL